MGVTALCWSFGGFIDYANIAMIFLLSTFLAALAFGRGAGVVSAFLNVAFFDFFSFLQAVGVLRPCQWIAFTQYRVRLLFVCLVLGFLAFLEKTIL